MNIWHNQGIAHYGFNPVMTYESEPNRYINNHASGSGKVIDGNGHYYYVSHPPLSYYLPYAILSGIGLTPEALHLQSFQLLIHLLSVILVYFVAWELLPTKSLTSSFLPLLTASLYLFSPATLWFQANVYMADTLVQLFFIGTVLLLLRLWRQNERVEWLKVGLFLLVFAMCYTHWLGYFVVATFVMGSIKKRWRSFLGKQVILPSLGGAAIAFGIMVAQYSQISGLDAYLAEMAHRFSIRGSGQALSLSRFTSHLATLVVNYAANHLPVLLLLAGMALVIRFNKAVRFSLEPVQAFFLYTAFIPPFLLHILLLNYSVHDFTTLYASLGFCGLITIFGTSLYSWVDRKTMLLAGLVVIAVSTGQYYYINRPGDVSLRGDRYDKHKVIADQINQLSSDNQVVFLLSRNPSPQLIYYAERNVQPVADNREARQFLNQHDKARGLLLEIDKRKVKVKERIRK
jgi:hypothetical protein